MLSQTNGYILVGSLFALLFIILYLFWRYSDDNDRDEE